MYFIDIWTGRFQGIGKEGNVQQKWIFQELIFNIPIIYWAALVFINKLKLFF